MPNENDAQQFIANNGTVASKLEVATEMVDNYIGSYYVPESVYNEAIYALAQELWNRQKSPGGFSKFGDTELVGRLARDPMESIRPMLRPYLVNFS